MGAQLPIYIFYTDFNPIIVAVEYFRYRQILSMMSATGYGPPNKRNIGGKDGLPIGQ